MKLGMKMKLGFKRGQKGFTLVELMVVMAIMAVLAGIVVPAVSGTSEVSSDAQVKSDAGIVSSAISGYYSDQSGAEVLTTDTSTILGTSAAQVKSSRWPEEYLDVTYAAELPNDAAALAGDVEAVAITDLSGTDITPTALAEGWNAINLAGLATGGYIPSVPKSSSDLSGSFHNYLWLVEKTSAAVESGDTVESRSVEVFKLAYVVEGELGYYTLTYQQIY